MSNSECRMRKIGREDAKDAEMDIFDLQPHNEAIEENQAVWDRSLQVAEPACFGIASVLFDSRR